MPDNPMVDKVNERLYGPAPKPEQPLPDLHEGGYDEKARRVIEGAVGFNDLVRTLHREKDATRRRRLADRLRRDS